MLMIMTFIPLVTAAAVFVTFIYISTNWLRTYRRRAKLIKENGCQPAPHFPHVDPILGLDYFWQSTKAYKEHRFFPYHGDILNKHGSTVQVTQWGSEILLTKDWRQIRHVMNTDFESWGVEPIRFKALYPLLWRGYFSLDGQEWKHKRAQTRLPLSKVQFGDLNRFEGIFKRYLALIPRDGKTPVQMRDLNYRLMLANSTEYFLGKELNLIDGGEISAEDQEMSDQIDFLLEGMFTRMVMGNLVKWIPVDKSFLRASRASQAFVDRNISRALQCAHGKTEKSRTNFLDDMIESQPPMDREEMISQALQMYVAGTDTTAGAVTALIYIMAHNPECFRKLRAEVLATCDGIPTYDDLQRMKYLQATAHESLRLYGVANAINLRCALRDTVLPFGGGSDGNSPLFVKKGTRLMICYAALHSDPSIWGDDVLLFRPERFMEKNTRDFYMFQPFGGGPRNCPGQALAWTTMLYTTARLVQEFKDIQKANDLGWVEHIKLTALNLHGAEVYMTGA